MEEKSGKCLNKLVFFDVGLFEDVNPAKIFIPGILAALFYGVVSGSMSFINKILLTSYDFHFPNVLMLAQVTVTSIILEGLRLTGYLDIPKYTKERAIRFLIPSVCFALQTTLALKALTILSIPMYNVLRRLLPLVTLIFGRVILNKTPSLLIVTSIIMVVSGCFLAGVGDLQFSLDAYVCALASVLSQAIYLTYVQKTGVEEGISALGVLHLNSVNCIPILLIYVLTTKEISVSLHYTGYVNSGFEVTLIIDVLMGCILNYSLFLCATMNSALTTSLVGVIKGVLTTIIGFFTFGGVPVTVLIVTGICLNSLGGILYAYGKYLENVQKRIEKHSHLQEIEIQPTELNKLTGIHTKDEMKRLEDEHADKTIKNTRMQNNEKNDDIFKYKETPNY